MALRSRESILAANVARVERNLRAAAVFFDRHRDMFSWAPPRPALSAFPAWWRQAGMAPQDAAAAPGAEAFCARVLERTGALLLPSTVYGYGDSHFRMGLGREDFGAGLEVLDTYLKRDLAER